MRQWRTDQSRGRFCETSLQTKQTLLKIKGGELVSGTVSPDMRQLCAHNVKISDKISGGKDETGKERFRVCRLERLKSCRASINVSVDNKSASKVASVRFRVAVSGERYCAEGPGKAKPWLATVIWPSMSVEGRDSL